MVAVLVALACVYRARSVVLLVVISLILAIGLQRPVEFLEAAGMRRGPALAVLTIAGLLLFGGFLALILPPVVRQGLRALSERAPKYLNDLQHQRWVRHLDQSFNISDKINDVGKSLPDQALTIGSGLISGFVAMLTIIVLTLFFASDLPRLRHAFGRLLPPDRRERFEDVTGKVVVASAAT